MENIILVDDMIFAHSSYGIDLRLYDSVLSATGFDSINFTPFNIIQTNSPTARKRRRIGYDDHSEVRHERFHCGICKRGFSLKKTRDRHQESVHKKQSFPCSTCPQVFARKDIKSRHEAEKHSGRRRGARMLPNLSSESFAEEYTQINAQHPTSNYHQISIAEQDPGVILCSNHIDIDSSNQSVGLDVEDDDIDDEVPRRIHDCVGSSDAIHTHAFNNPLLLCINLLLRCKPYTRFFIHDKKRDLVCRQKWKPPNTEFCELYDLAIGTLRSRLASGTKDAELLAAIVAFVNVDVLMGGAETMGYHAKAMYSMKVHQKSRRHPIFDALKAAFEHCGKTCRSVRIIYTARGFVWMLNMGYRCLRIPVD